MYNLRYSVIENNTNNEKTEKSFDFSKENAVAHFESRCKTLDKELVGWKKEPGINSCIWSNGNQYKLIYVQIDGHENLEI